MKTAIFTILSILFISCVHSKKTLQEGDLVFQDLNCGELCDAIESVTEGRNGTDFSHCAMVVRYQGVLMIAEAIGKDVHVTPIDSFWNRSYADHSKTLVLRLSDSLRYLIPKAQDFVLEQIGKPYDDHFLLNNDQYYCSELIHDAFLHSNNNVLFELQPMTFKTPGTDSIMPAWKTYFEDIQFDVPEGSPGLNPGSMSRSSFLQEVTFNK